MLWTNHRLKQKSQRLPDWTKIHYLGKNGRNFSKLLFLFPRSHRTCNPILFHTETDIEEGNWWASHFLIWNSRQQNKFCNYEREHFYKYKMTIRRPNDIQITTIIVPSSARHTHIRQENELWIRLEWVWIYGYHHESFESSVCSGLFGGRCLRCAQ